MGEESSSLKFGHDDGQLCPPHTLYCLGGTDSPFQNTHARWRPLEEAHRANLKVVVGPRLSLGEVVNVHHRKQVGVLGTQQEMGLVPAAIFVPAGVLYDVRLQLPSCLHHLSTPGPQTHAALGGGRPILLAPPHGHVQTVDGDVLHSLRTQQVQEVHLDTPHVDLQLRWGHWFQAALPSSGEVAGHFYCVRGTAQVWVDPISAIVHLVFTAVEVPADAGWVFSGAQRILQTLDQAAEVVESLKDLWTLVQHGQVHRWLRLGPEWGVGVHDDMKTSTNVFSE